MSIKRALILLSLVLVVAMLGACVRSASTPPVNLVTPPTPEEGAQGAVGGPTQEGATGETNQEGAAAGQTQEGAAAGQTQEGVKSQPVPTNEVLMQLEQFVTQTAAAAQLAGGQPAGQQPGSTGQEATPAPSAGGQQPAGQQPAGQEATPGSTEGGQQPAGQQPAGQEATSVPAGTSGQTGSVQPTAAQPSSGQSGYIQPTAVPGSSQVQVPPPTQSQPLTVTVITATPGIPSTYTLQAGEFVYCIARRFNVNPLELLSINGLTTSTVVRGGTVLKIPQTGHPFPGERSLEAHPTTYVVQGSESIYEIACKFGSVSPDMIALANGLKEPYTLSSGQKLAIP